MGIKQTASRTFNYLAIIFACASLLCASACSVSSGAETSPGNTIVGDSPSDAPFAAAAPVDVAPSSPVVLDVDKNMNYVNVMGKQTPSLPRFPDVAKKAGYICGYVKDATGKPLQGAYLGVRATAIGGAYSGAHAESDAKGYYEIQVPWGVAHFYAAGYTIEWGDGLAALSLHPADGKTDSFASSEGAIENFVLLPYGVTSRENLSESPQHGSTYYGGSLYIGYWTKEANDTYAPPSNILEGSVIEITLTPEGEMLSGAGARSFVIRKIAGAGGGFKINNIPVGRYQISVKTEDGQPLKMLLNKPQGTIFGMSPTETTESASILFHPNSAKAGMAIAAHGNWNMVEISVEQP